MRPRLRPGSELRPLLDQVLARFVAWMRLAGNDQLNGTLWVSEQARSRGGSLREDSVAYGGEPTSKAQRQSIWMEHSLCDSCRLVRASRAAPTAGRAAHAHSV